MQSYYSCPFQHYYANVDSGMYQHNQPLDPPYIQPANEYEQYSLPLPQSPGIHIPPGVSDIYDVGEVQYTPTTASSEDPPPVLSNTPAVTTIALFKELSGYPNYGNPSGNADILYTRNRGIWTFQIPAFLFVPGRLTAQIVIRGVLDDHLNVPIERYSATIIVNGATVHTGPLPLEHGVPRGGRFTNWRRLVFEVPRLRRNNQVVIVNTSNTSPDDWIAFDWMELRLIPI